MTVKQRTILVALRDAQHANDAQPVGTVAVARWCPEPWLIEPCGVAGGVYPEGPFGSTTPLVRCRRGAWLRIVSIEGAHDCLPVCAGRILERLDHAAAKYQFSRRATQTPAPYPATDQQHA